VTRKLKPARRIGGTLTVPGDKSIAHRAALLSILSEGPIEIKNFPNGADCQTSLAVARKLGVTVETTETGLKLTPPAQLQLEPDTIIDCGNSGTTARLLAGLISGTNLSVNLAGDESLSERPMRRIIDPLTAMGAELFATDSHLPMKVRGNRLLPFEYRLPVASAQVKSAILLAGLAAKCSVTLKEEVLTRDHTETMLSAIGEGLSVRDIKAVAIADPDDPRKKRLTMPENFKREIKLASSSRVIGGIVDIPGDISTAAFFFAAAAIGEDTITISNLGLNPTRTGFLDYLKSLGCKVTIADKAVISGEPRGTVTVEGAPLRARKITGETVVELIDEIPIVAVMAAFADGTTVIRDAAELKVKESDRLVAIADNLTRMGIKCGVLEDGLAIEGGRELQGADIISHGDHRIAMAFSIASLFASGPSTLDRSDIVDISCPGFFDLLLSIVS
jgi:3-phosphoshikimate 1-carboxyvinyltransferase